MTIRLNAERIKAIKNIAKKYVLITSVSTIILSSPITEAKAQSYYNNNYTDEQYQISDDGDFLHIENSNDLSIIKSLKKLTELSIYNSNIDYYIEESNISILTLKDCSFLKSTIKLPNTITELEIDNTKINFDILKYLPSLKKITFRNMEFNSLSELTYISKITELNFDYCNIGSIEGIQNLLELDSLSFVDTGIENIDQLKELKNLKSLTLSHTYVTDLSPIKNLNISFLDITDSTNIKNLDVITEMKKLSSFIATNCEMTLTQKVIDYITKQNIYSNISEEGLSLQNEVDHIIAKLIKTSMNDEEKIETIINYIINNLEYDYRVYDDPFLLEEYNNNALKYALQGKGVCKNYTALTTALLRKANISGYEQENPDHIWNIVELNDQYYYIDSTFIDTDEIIILSENENFLTNDEEFLLNHNSILLPSTMYNKLHNLTPQPSNQNNANKTQKKHSLKKATLGAATGIAIALGSAFAIKKTKKKKSKQL